MKIKKLDEINDAVAEHSDYIATQVLANSIELVDKIDNPTELDFEDYLVKILVTKQ